MSEERMFMNQGMRKRMNVSCEREEMHVNRMTCFFLYVFIMFVALNMKLFILKNDTAVKQNDWSKRGMVLDYDINVLANNE